MNETSVSVGRGFPALVPAWLVEGCRLVRKDLRRRWLLYALFAGAWVVGMLKLLGVPIPLMPVLFNITPSLPYHVAVVDYSWKPPHLSRGDYVAYTYRGSYPGMHGLTLFKRVAGLPGDVVSVIGHEVYVNGVPVGRAKPLSRDGRVLSPIAAGTIPAGSIYVQGDAPDSFDSRYSQSGLVRIDQLGGRVLPVF